MRPLQVPDCYHRPYWDYPQRLIWFNSVFTFKFSSAPPFLKRKVSSGWTTQGSPWTLGLLQ